jgi:hypothetical protein
MRETRRERPTVVRITQSAGRPATTGALALAPGDAPRERRRPHLSLVGTSTAPRAAREDAREAGEATVRLIVEVLAGTCPPRHLAGRAVPDVWQGLALIHRAALPHRPVAPPRVLRTWFQDPAPGAMETGAVVVLHGHVHALAVRLERHRGHWRCTALETTVPPVSGHRPVSRA